MKKAIIIIVAVIAVLGATFAIIFFTGKFAANKNFAKLANKLMGVEETKYESYNQVLNTIKADESTTTDLNMSMNISVPSSIISYSDQKLINASSLKLKTSYDKDTKASLVSAELLKDGKDVISLDTLIDGNTISIKSDDLTDKKYLKIDPTKIEEFATKNGISLDSNTKEALSSLSNLNNVNAANLLYDYLYISEEDYNAINKSYENVLVDLIDKKAYSSKSEKIEVDGKERNTKAYTLTLTGEEAYNFLEKLIKKYKDDSTMKKVYENKINSMKKYLESIGSVSSSDLSDLDEISYDKLFDEILQSLQESKSTFTSIEQCAKFTIYSYKNEPVRFDVALMKDKKDDGTVIFTETLNKGETVYTINVKNLLNFAGTSEKDSEINILDTGVDVSDYTTYARTTDSHKSTTSAYSSYASLIDEITITDKYTKTDTSRKGTITLGAKISGQKINIIEIDYDTVNSKSEFKENYSIKLSSDVSTFLTTASPQFKMFKDAKLDIVCEMTGLDTDKKSVKFEIAGSFSSYSIKLAVNGTITNKSEVPTLTSSNSIDVLSLSTDELRKTAANIFTNAANTLPNKLANYGIKVSKDSIMKYADALNGTTATAETNTGDSVAITTEETPAA